MNIKFFIIWFLIYTINFWTLGNTIWRQNSDGIFELSLISLITSGFFGPIKTCYLLLSNGYFLILFNYLLFEITNFSNPFTVYLYLYITSKFTNLLD